MAEERYEPIPNHRGENVAMLRALAGSFLEQAHREVSVVDRPKGQSRKAYAAMLAAQCMCMHDVYDRAADRLERG